jgi:hypothetical protein
VPGILSASEFENTPAHGGGAALAQYRRALREVAEHQVVDEAEDVLARSWIGQLDEMRRTALGLLAAARLARNAARAELRLAEERGRPDDLALAHARLRSIEAEQDDQLYDARAFIASVDAELELVCAAGIERARRDRADTFRLLEARCAVYGDGDGVRVGEGEGERKVSGDGGSDGNDGSNEGASDEPGA